MTRVVVGGFSIHGLLRYSKTEFEYDTEDEEVSFLEMTHALIEEPNFSKYICDIINCHQFYLNLSDEEEEEEYSDFYEILEGEFYHDTAEIAKFLPGIYFNTASSFAYYIMYYLEEELEVANVFQHQLEDLDISYDLVTVTFK